MAVLRTPGYIADKHAPCRRFHSDNFLRRAYSSQLFIHPLTQNPPTDNLNQHHPKESRMSETTNAAEDTARIRAEFTVEGALAGSAWTPRSPVPSMRRAPAPPGGFVTATRQ